MAVVLFKPTDGKPQVCVVNEYSYLHLLEQGWYYSPDDFPPVEVPSAEPEPEKKPKARRGRKPKSALEPEPEPETDPLDEDLFSEPGEV